jgi:mannan endo-1,4-beta-mannosidase
MSAVRWRLAAGGLGLAVALCACGIAPSATSGSGSGSGGPAGSGGSVAQQAAPTAPAKTLSIAALTHPDGKYFGIEANGSPDSLTPVQEVAASVGRNPNLLGQYLEWKRPFDQAAAARATSYGALYYMAWEPFGTTVASIADGASDAYVRGVARSVAAFHAPVAISFGHEMNGNWYPWGTTQATAAQFVAAWRHIHDLFAAAGANNVIWVWNPNIVNPMPDVELAPYWPGSAYVNWVGITGYFATTGPHTFAGVYGPTLAEVRKFTSEPVIIAETAVETGGDEVESVRNLIGGVKANGDVLGFIWFDYDKAGVDWTLGDRPIARAAVASGIAGMHLVSLSG